MAKFTLEPEYDFNFLLYGIASHEPDYKLCIALNEALAVEFHRTTPLELNKKKQNGELLFSCFTGIKEIDQTEFSFFANLSFNSASENTSDKAQASLFDDDATHGQKSYLIPELEEMNYFLLVRTEYNAEIADEIENKLKAIPMVLNVLNIDPVDLPSKNNLIFE
jgi:hypothetical protein